MMTLTRRDGVTVWLQWFNAIDHDDEDFTVFLKKREEGEEDIILVLDQFQTLPQAEALHLALNQALAYKRKSFDIRRWFEQFDSEAMA